MDKPFAIPLGLVTIAVVILDGKHSIPFRTRQLRSSRPMIVSQDAKVGRHRLLVKRVVSLPVYGCARVSLASAQMIGGRLVRPLFLCAAVRSELVPFGPSA